MSSRPVRESVIVLCFPVTFSLMSGSARDGSVVSSSPKDNGSMWGKCRGGTEDGRVLLADEVCVSLLEGRLIAKEGNSCRCCSMIGVVLVHFAEMISYSDALLITW